MENKIPSPLERIKFDKAIASAEREVIRQGNYQIGK